MTWETWTNGLNQSEIACSVKSGCLNPGEYITNNNTFFGSYQGVAFLIFTILGFIAIIFGFYLITIGYGFREKKEPEPKLKGKIK